jgi:hypothetical protein
MAVAGSDEPQPSDSGLDRDDDIVRAPRHGAQPPIEQRQYADRPASGSAASGSAASRSAGCLAPLVIVLVVAAVIFVVLKLTGLI